MQHYICSTNFVFSSFSQEFENKPLESTSYSTVTPSIQEETLIKLTPSDKEFLRKLDKEHREKMAQMAKDMEHSNLEVKNEIRHEKKAIGETKNFEGIEVSKNPKAKQAVSKRSLIFVNAIILLKSVKRYCKATYSSVFKNWAHGFVWKFSRWFRTWYSCRICSSNSRTWRNKFQFISNAFEHGQNS